MDTKLLKHIKEVRDAFVKSDVVGMRILSNSLIEEAAIENDKRLAEIALIGYSLHKLSTKEHIVSHSRWVKVKRKVISSLEKAIGFIESGNKAGFEKTVRGIDEELRSIDFELGYFVQGLLEKARVKYAANAYSLGLSLSQATELTGADKKSVLEYVGATKIVDKEKAPKGIGARLKKLRKVL
ncbi:MAG: hypothetical protein CL943_03690 [Candidatus Diapherotrites archaeon]|uniref:Uncharacterized protein n=1 Tax=Candidatus Iainarchaeum sp. TaxID=3101447 RepID=A0A2D6M1Q9_9ARCH|nr:hypothetical protein [Candidatus Diapherotrites archaeon]|tara:strand:- start:4458 stop:5006 length:549 start_codon:yes stop_codon:yes gene_type:complete